MARQAPVDPALGSLARASARISVLFCVTAVLSLPFALQGHWTSRVSLVLAALVSCLAVAVQTFVRRGGPLWRPVMLTTLCLVTALISASTRDLRPDAAHQLVSWTNAGIGGALAFGFGARWGAAALVLGMGAAFGVEQSAGGAVALGTAVGPLTYVLGSSVARVAALRGDAATEQALTARQAAEAALDVAERRWEAARSAQRELHDTVLATLTLLSHRGEGVPREAVVRACARDAALLRRGVLTGHAPAAPHPARPAPADGARAPDGGTRGSLLGREVEAVADDLRGPGFDVRIHVGGAAGTAPVSAAVAAAVREALRECLRNARRHAGVEAADVTVLVDGGQAGVVVLDEGRGFDPSAVPPDRLGLRESVTGRLAAVGGSASVWSGPGLGTSILLSVPVETPPAGPAGPAAVDPAPAR